MKIAADAQKMLTERLLPFWNRLRDDERGGFFGYMGYDLSVNREVEKGCILNSRILWFYSETAMLTGREDARENALHAWNFLKDYCVDRENGGMFWSVTCDGKPLDTTKHTYNQAFAIYALASYYRLTRNAEALALAKELFGIIETRCRDEGGYLESFDRYWQPGDNDKLSENGVMAERTMNTLLHVMEAYSGLYMADKDSATAEALKNCLEICMNRVYSPAKRRLEVFFDSKYRSLIDLHSYGHDIEASWLAEQGANLLGDTELNARMRDVSAALADHVYNSAFADNSLLNECENGVDNTLRIWWVQAEAVLGFVNAFERTGETRYADAVKGLWGYINTVLTDPRPGSEWFWSVNADGTPTEKPIVEPWKCPYHNGRMCIELIRRNPDVEI